MIRKILRVSLDVLFVLVCVFVAIYEYVNHWGVEPARAVTVTSIIVVAAMKALESLVEDLSS